MTINALVMGTSFRPLPILHNHPQDLDYQIICLQKNQPYLTLEGLGVGWPGLKAM